MRRTSLISVAVALLVLLSVAPSVSAWTSRTHGHIATDSWEVLPDYYKENLDDSMLYSAALAPDDWRGSGGPVHQFRVSESASSNPGNAGLAFDGDPNTYWRAANPGDGEWIRIDLGAAYPINKVRFIGVENRPDVSVQYSSNGTTWYTSETVSNAWHDGDSTREHTRQYWRLYFSGVPAGSYAKVAEIQLYARGDNAHKSDWCTQRAAYWLRRARDNYAAENWDNALYAMGIAAHYIGDATALVHNRYLWEGVITPSEWVNESPSGWSRHKHYEEQMRYYDLTRPSPKNYSTVSLEDYINNYMIPYLDNLNENQERVETDWLHWLSTRDCEPSKSRVDNAAQLWYDALISMFYELRGAPPGGFGAAAAGSESKTLMAETGTGQIPVFALLFGGLLSLLTATFTLRKGKPLKRRFRLRRDERGVTPVIGAVIVIALLTIAGMTLVSSWIPEQERKNEADHMDAVRDVWQELQRVILNHENTTIKVKMGADSASVFGLFGQPMNPGHIWVNPAKWVKRIAPEADMYIGQTPPSSGTENFLFAQSNASNNKRAFLRFNLSTLPADANIVEARLLVFADVSQYTSTWDPDGAGGANPVTGYSGITQLLEVRKVGNDTWDEGSPPGWPGPEAGDVMVNGDWPWENTWEISYDNMWYTFNLTDYVKAERNAGDDNVSICIKAVKEDSSLLRYAIINSKENPYRRPHLLVVYERANVAGVPTYDDNWGSIADGGSIVFEARNKQYDDYTFAFESGGLIMERFGSGTMMISNPDLVVPLKLDWIENGDNIQIYVNRYRIVNQGHFSSTGDAVLTVTVRENTELGTKGQTLNIDNLTVAVKSDYPKAWRGTHPLVMGGYFTDLAGRFDLAGSLDWIFEYWDSDGGDIAIRDFDLNAITIFGRHRGPVISGSPSVCPVDKDIFYKESVYDVRVDISMA